MEFLTVGTSKIKILLTKDEAKARGIGSDCSGDDPEKRRNFRKILEEAKERVGFDVGHEKVLIQIYSTADGGLELFVTKLGALSKEVASVIARSERVAVLSTKRVFYIFESFSDLIGAARSIPHGLAEDSTAYRLDGGEYCLSFCEREQRGLSPLSRILEFGRKLNPSFALGLEEHASVLLSGDAVEKLSHL